MNPPTSLGEILARHREQLGESVSLDELFDLYAASVGAGSLSEEERTALLDRVAADPEAAQGLLALRRFSSTPVGEDADGVEDRWIAFREQLDSPAEPSVANQPGVANQPSVAIQPSVANQPDEPDRAVAHFPVSSEPSRFRYVGLAASLVLYSWLVFWLGQSHGPGAAGGSGASDIWINTPVVELSTDEAVYRGTARIGWPGNAQALVVVMSAPDVSSRHPLGLVVLDVDGALISASSGLEPDDAGLYFATLHRGAMTPGLYEIQLRIGQDDVVASFPIEIVSTP